MCSWRKEILQLFERPLSSLSIVSDPDGLLHDEKLLSQFQDRNVVVMEVQDTIGFRYIFESKYRALLKNNAVTLIVRTENDINSLPYDLLMLGAAHHQVSLTTIFPKLSYPVLKQLDVSDFDALYTVYEQYQGSSSDNDTIEFLLKKVYKVHFDIIETITDFLKFLLSYHYKGKCLPSALQTYFINQLKQNENINSLPVDELVQSKSYFYTYLQNEWNEYILELNKEKNIGKDPFVTNDYHHTQHAFADHDVRRLMSDLFLENKLQPVKGLNKKEFPLWTHSGISTDRVQDKVEKLLPR